MSYAAWSSEGRTADAAVKPCRSAFSEELCLPAAVRGPVERRAFARLARVRGSGDGVGIGFVMRTSSSVVAWLGRDFARRIADVVGWAGKIDAGVA